MSETSNALVEQLSAGAELVAEGGFNLDLEAAQAKLASYRLADPQTFVLILVEVAHLLPTCTHISFEHRVNRFEIHWHGVSLDEGHLRELIAARKVQLGEAEDPDPLARARKQALRALALALLALDSVEHRGACLATSGARLQLDIAPGGSREPSLSETKHALISETQLILYEPLISIGGWRRSGTTKHRFDLLRSRARYATKPVEIGGERINEGFTLVELTRPYGVRDESGRLLAVVGLSPARPRATLLFVANGVLLEKVFDDELPAYRVGLVNASDLRRDLSLTKLLRDESYARRIHEVRRAARQLSGGEIARYVGREAKLRPFHWVMISVVLAIALVGVLGLLSLGGGASAGVLISLILGLLVSQPVSVVLRRKRLQTEESLAIATVVAVDVIGTPRVLRCLVHAPGREPHEGQVLVDDPLLEHVHEGERIHVHVNPRRPTELTPAARPVQPALGPAGENE